MTQDIIEEYMVTDGKPVLVKKTVVEKEVPPDLTALKVLEEFYKMPLDIHNATMWEIETWDGIECLVEAQEHCDLVDVGNHGYYQGCYFTVVNLETKQCYVKLLENIDESFDGFIKRWSFDYGKTWEGENDRS